MNRRTLLASFAVALTLPRLAQAAPSASRCGTAFRTFEHPPAAGAGHASLTVKVRRQGGIVAPLPTADELLAPVIEAGHERAGIEFYIVAQDTLPAPPELDLESIFMTWISLEGAAAVKRTGGIAVLQDGATRWKVSTSGGEEWSPAALLEELALIVSGLASQADAGSGTTLLELLPSAANLPDGWRLAAERVEPEPCER